MSKTQILSQGYTADMAIGITVNDLLFRRKKTRRQLAESMGLSHQAVSRKVLGQVGWSVSDLFAVADFFNVEVSDLLPKKVENAETPDSFSRTEGSGLVAGAGFEPTTSGL
ncbi:MAG: helix-turn-helix transcriptional regulator [Corynebacterium sp.]|nr:helix-turn-helix transcriptional regulator [Corynebacterium sp.]